MDTDYSQRGEAAATERDCAESQSQQRRRTEALRLVFDTAALRIRAESARTLMIVLRMMLRKAVVPPANN